MLLKRSKSVVKSVVDLSPVPVRARGTLGKKGTTL